MELIVRTLGCVDYTTTWQAMQAFTAARTDTTPDELWLLEHPSVFTLGQAGRPEHVLGAGDIPVVQSDRGGQVTWHGPGQLVAYVLFDLRRLNIGPRVLVEHMEHAIVATLAELGIAASPRADAHGVYVGNDRCDNGSDDQNSLAPADKHRNERKIAALGLRIRRGCSYHGLALNMDPDLAPFARINPCGHAGMAVTCVRDETATRPDPKTIAAILVRQLGLAFGYDQISHSIKQNALNCPP